MCWSLGLNRIEFYLYNVLVFYETLFKKSLYNAICNHSELFLLAAQCLALIRSDRRYRIHRKLITWILKLTTFLRFG